MYVLLVFSKYFHNVNFFVWIIIFISNHNTQSRSFDALRDMIKMNKGQALYSLDINITNQ